MNVSFRFALAVLAGALAPYAGMSPAMAQQQGERALLDEITVTAQRREQRLQEVPVSIEAVTGAEIQLQGFRDLRELGNYSPSVYIDDSGFLSQDRSIRGFGTSGNALTLDQAVPIFVDGIHFGRPAQVRLAFMDPARVEILKGPQPVFFGMNATAGAFNIISAGPTPEWEGYLDAEYGNNSTAVLNGAIGGPLTDTLGIRVAAKYDSADGFIRDVVTGRDLGGYENLGGRVILEFNPRENLQITAKAEYAEIDKDPEATVMCLTDGTLVYERNRDGTPAPEGRQGNERSIWADPPQGVGWSNAYEPLTTNCASDLGDSGISNGGPFFVPPENIREENSSFGALDARQAVDQWIKLVGLSDGLDDTNERIESSNGYVEVAYQFANDIELNWLTGFSVMDRVASRDNTNTPFLLNYQNRGTDFDQYSSELRFTSGAGGVDLGGTNLEWMLGFFWQKTDLDFTNNSPRPAIRRGMRFNSGGEDVEWKSIFATVTLNMGDRFSLDLGGRFTDLDKIGFISGLAGQWIFDVRPCDPDVVTDGLNPPPADPATCALHEDALQITAADAEFLLPGADQSNLWIIPWRASRDTPLSWIGGRASAVGLTAVADLEGDGPYGPGRGGDFDTEEFDPQVTLRFRPNDNHSLFLRYAESFKAGGFDTGVTSINEFCTSPLPEICPTLYENFRFEGESASTIELGSKGTLWDGRARYDVTAFETTFEDLQISVATGIPDDPFLNVNAGEQRVRGIEFGLTTAVNDSLTLIFNGALMDGEFTKFPNAGCTEVELAAADTGPCISEAESEALVGSDDLEGTIDRSGFPAPKTPDWKLVLGADYDIPVRNDFLININARGYLSDGYITDVNGFSEIVKMNEHEDLNLTLSFGPQDGTWQLAAYGRNLLEAKPEYNPEFDLVDNGIAGSEGTDGGVQMSRSNYRSYGLKFRYNFQ
ncbi:MAG: TonB-dependent receptor [Gammaproteobacteria bacterium]|nr:TonB-dependent receptor [Gammaproteobacteria bacterium]